MAGNSPFANGEFVRRSDLHVTQIFEQQITFQSYLYHLIKLLLISVALSFEHDQCLNHLETLGKFPLKPAAYHCPNHPKKAYACHYE